jgi:hypothetical protein
MQRRSVSYLLGVGVAAVALAVGPSASGQAGRAAAFAPGDLIVTGRGVGWYRSDGSLVTKIVSDSVATNRLAYRAAGGPRPLYVLHDPLLALNYDADGNALYFFLLDPLADRTNAIALGPSGDGYIASSHGRFLNQIYGFREDPTKGSGTALASFFVVASEISDLDVGVDGCSLFVATRTLGVMRFDACTFRLHPSLLPGTNVSRVRLLPDATLLLVQPGQGGIKRIDGTGKTVREYSTPGVSDWVGLDMTPDGTGFWAASGSGNLYRFDFISGSVVQGPIRIGDRATDIAVAGAPLGAAPAPLRAFSSQELDLDGVSPLTGVTFSGIMPVRSTPEKVCTPAASQLVFSDASGVAIGQYPGRFGINATATIGAQSLARRIGSLGQQAGPLQTFRSSFTIASGSPVTGTITGSRAASNLATCSTFTRRTFPQSPIFPPNYSLSGYEWTVSAASLRYQASIRHGGRTYTDSGSTSIVATRFHLLDDLGRDSGSGGRFGSRFVSDSIGVTDAFGSTAQTRTHTAGVPAKTPAIEVVVRWSGAGDSFTLSDFRVVGTRATKSAAVERPKVAITRGRRSVTARVTNIRGGRVGFAVKPRELNGGGKATTTVRKAGARKKALD